MFQNTNQTWFPLRPSQTFGSKNMPNKHPFQYDFDLTNIIDQHLTSIINQHWTNKLIMCCCFNFSCSAFWWFSFCFSASASRAFLASSSWTQSMRSKSLTCFAATMHSSVVSMLSQSRTSNVPTSNTSTKRIAKALPRVPKPSWSTFLLSLFNFSKLNLFETAGLCFVVGARCLGIALEMFSISLTSSSASTSDSCSSRFLMRETIQAAYAAACMLSFLKPVSTNNYSFWARVLLQVCTRCSMFVTRNRHPTKQFANRAMNE